MNLNTLVLTKQMGTGHSGIYKKMYFPESSVEIFVIISVLPPLPSETENVKRKTLSACERPNPYWQNYSFGRFCCPGSNCDCLV